MSLIAPTVADCLLLAGLANVSSGVYTGPPLTDGANLGGNVSTVALPKDGSQPNLLIASTPANAAGGDDRTLYGSAHWKNGATGTLQSAYAYLLNGSRQPAASGVLVITPSFTIPAGKKIRLVYQKTDGTEFGETLDTVGAGIITSSVSCAASGFRRMQTLDASGNLEGWIPSGQYLSLSRGIVLGLQRGPQSLGDVADTDLTAEYKIGWNTTKGDGQTINRITPPTDVDFTDGVKIPSYDASIPVPEDGQFAGGESCQFFQLKLQIAGVEPPVGGQCSPRMILGGNAVAA